MPRFQLLALGLLLAIGCSSGSPLPPPGSGQVGGGTTPTPNPLPPNVAIRYHPDAIRRVFTAEVEGFRTAYAETNDGRTLELLPGLASLGNAEEIFVSPDETKSAVLVERGSGEQDIYVSSLKNPDDRTRITTLDLRFISDVIWCTDKNPPAVLFSAQQNGVWKLFVAPCDGSGPVALASGILPGVEKDADGSIWFRSGSDLLVIPPGGAVPILAPGVTQSSILTRFQFSEDKTKFVYSHGELYFGATRISTETGSSGDVDASKVVFGPNGRYVVYFRVHTASGELAAYLADLSNLGAEPVLISFPIPGAPPREVKFSADGSRILFRQGVSTLLVHEIGKVTRMVIDVNPSGRIDRFDISDDGELVSMTAKPDAAKRNKALFVKSDGSWSQWLDLTIDSSECRDLAFLPAPPGGDEKKTYVSRIVRNHQGVALGAKLETLEFDLSQATPSYRVFVGYDLPADMGIWSFRFDPGRFAPGDDPHRALDIEFNVGDLRFAADGLDSGEFRPSFLGRGATYKSLTNNRFDPVRVETDKLIRNYRITANHLGNPNFPNIWNVEVFSDGKLHMWSWAPLFNRLAKPQFSVGFGSLLDQTVILDERDTPGRAVLDFSQVGPFDSVEEMFEYALDGWMPLPRMEYTSDRVTQDRNWVLELSRFAMY